MGTPSKRSIFFCTLYTDCLDGRTDAVARHVSFAYIIYVVLYCVLYAKLNM